ncbi:diacylglycerol kinase [soil metagenome]
MRSFLVIANEAAGTAGGGVLGDACAVLAAEGECEPVGTSGPDELDAVLGGVGGRTVVVAGGDGSLHAVVDRLWQRGELETTTLGLVPLGTGNDFARALDIPIDAVAAAQLICRGAPTAFDLIVADEDHTVVNAAHWGLGAEAARLGGGLKDRLGAAAYPIGALIAAVRERGWTCRIEVDGTPVGDPDEPVLLAGVGNGRSIGGGTPLFPQADPSDGLLDVVVCHATGPVARAAFGAALRNGGHVEREDVATRRGRHVRVTGDPVRHNADGELTDELTTRTYRIEPAAWNLLLSP